MSKIIEFQSANKPITVRHIGKQNPHNRYKPTISMMLTGAEYALIDIYRSVTDNGKSHIINESYNAEKKWGVVK